jgi:hypothetical protein
MSRLRAHGEVIKVPVVSGIPVENQAKIARFLVASTMSKNICMIDDIDTVHLQTHFLYNRLSKRENGKILAIGHEVYENSPHAGKFPAGNMTAEGDVFKLLLNPSSIQDYKDLVRSLINIRSIDGKENVLNSANSFSDESLIRALILENNLGDMVQKVRRDVNIREDWIDRSWWNIDREKLFSGKYICCNFFRPGRENYSHFLPIFEYLYGHIPSQGEVFIL